MKTLSYRLGLLLISLFMPLNAQAQLFEEGELVTSYLEIEGNQIRVGIQPPSGGTPVADVLFLQGFADRVENERELFAEYNRAGLRVITFDYPSQGASNETSAFSGLNYQSFRSITHIGKTVLDEVFSQTHTPKSRPLCLAGWSTGGLIVTRAIQSKRFPDFGKPISAVSVITPGVKPKLLVGKWGIVTKDTLTQNPTPPMWDQSDRDLRY